MTSELLFCTLFPMFDPVDPHQSFPDLEKGILQYWREENLFHRSVEHRKQGISPHSAEASRGYSFYDGPPFATGLPHYGHLLAGTIKDVIPRYQTMRGKYVERRFGWDCHGLPIENLIEKEQGIKSKRDIEAMGVAKFNALCRASVQRFANEWRTTVERTGRWVDMDWDYRTMDSDYMESIWWAFSQVHEKGLLYEGHRPIHICPRCATPLSNFEVGQGYKDVTDVSATAMFEIVENKQTSQRANEPTFLLAWTTTPWTLPGNLFLAVHPKVPYARVQSEGKTYIVAKDLVESVFKDKEFSIGKKLLSAKELIGKPYTPLFPYFAKAYEKNTFRIVPGDFVTTDEGTGIVHIAPGFGEDDFMVGKREGIDPPLQHVTIDGHFTTEVTDFADWEVKPAGDPSKTDKAIIDWLKKHNLLFSSVHYTHSYPHCWRCDTPLLNYATSSWFVAVEKIKPQLLENAQRIAWMPPHLKEGRFGKWLQGARDWSISRNRYWGTPLPVWRSDVTGDIDVLGSRDDLMMRAKLRFTKVTALRHGESEGNCVPIYQGKLPGTDLTKRGRAQATATAKELARERTPVSVIYCSPLARTRQTAEILAKECAAELIVDERLREVTFGEYEGKSIDFGNMNMVRMRRAKKLETHRPESVYHFPGMETWEQVQGRINGFLEDILPRHRGEHIAIVTHADPLQNLRNFFTKEDPWKISHQPYPSFAEPFVFFWDHDRQSELDLHKDAIDDITWPGSDHKSAVHLTMVRHGETDWNAERRIQGSESDEPLNEHGEEQAHALAKTLRKKTFDVILCSTLRRSRQTAEILVRERGMSITAEWPELNERALGTWAGRKIEDVLREHPLPGATAATMHYETPENGESLSALLHRIECVYQKLLAEYAGKKVLIVTHGGIVRALQGFAEQRSYREMIAIDARNSQAVSLTLTPLMKRIPDVLDCWFESGSMPYAQMHYPFSKKRIQSENINAVETPYYGVSTKMPAGFPADFIAEGVDQTRLWFYTLHVLGTILFDDAPYKNVVVNGIVLAEDGKKMSKRLKNYPDPMEVVEKYGADALRFALMNSPAVRAEELRFSTKVVEETVRSVVLPLWNAYSFFVTYANAAGFEPAGSRRTSTHPLDRAIRAEVQDLCNRMTQELENYDLSATCSQLFTTIDTLTNWYIRLSRRRFGGKSAIDAAEAHTEDHAEEQQDALGTLYDVLITLSQLLAPFCPFVTEAIYLNLIREDHGSVHLTDWPQPRTLTKEETTLLSTMRVLRAAVSLGMQLRSSAKVKVRQPLARATVAIPPAILPLKNLSEQDRALLRQELNVKDLVLTADPGSLGTAMLKVDARKVGPRVGGKVQELIAAGKSGEFEQRPDGGYLVLDETLGPEDAMIVYSGTDGAEVAAEGGIVVALDTTMTEDLKEEGAMRDLIRTVQRLRKETGLMPGDKILLDIDPVETPYRASLLEQETNATLGKNDGEVHEMDLDGKKVTIRFKKLP